MLFFFSSRRRHTRYWRDWSSDVCSSDLSTDEDRIAGLRCGVEAYIRKPFQAEELFITINNLLTARRLLQEKYTRLTQDTAFFTGSSASQENRMPHEIVSAHGNSPMPMEEVPPIVARSEERRVGKECRS